jgi:hypothetical protein
LVDALVSDAAMLVDDFRCPAAVPPAPTIWSKASGGPCATSIVSRGALLHQRSQMLHLGAN